MTDSNRRQVLAMLGAGALGASGLLVGSAAGSPPWTAQIETPTSDGDGRVRIAWYETYNDTLQENQGGTAGDDAVNASTVLDPMADPAYVDEPSGPVITLEGILPGDAGTLTTGIFLAERPPGADSLAIDIDATVDDAAEGGLIEPERRTGDAVGSAGELADALRVRVWHDAGVSPCDGRESLGDTTLATGTLVDVAATLTGTRLCDGCFGGRSRHCIGLAWSLPAAAGNDLQTDATTFTFELRVLGATPEAGR